MLPDLPHKHTPTQTHCCIVHSQSYSRKLTFFMCGLVWGKTSWFMEDFQLCIYPSLFPPLFLFSPAILLQKQPSFSSSEDAHFISHTFPLLKPPSLQHMWCIHLDLCFINIDLILHDILKLWLVAHLTWSVTWEACGVSTDLENEAILLILAYASRQLMSRGWDRLADNSL